MEERVDVPPAAEALKEIERIPRAMFSSASVSSLADNGVPTRRFTYESSLEHCTRVGRQMDTDALGKHNVSAQLKPRVQA